MHILEKMAKANNTTAPLPRAWKPAANPTHYKNKGSLTLYGMVR